MRAMWVPITTCEMSTMEKYRQQSILVYEYSGMLGKIKPCTLRVRASLDVIGRSVSSAGIIGPKELVIDSICYGILLENLPFGDCTEPNFG